MINFLYLQKKWRSPPVENKGEVEFNVQHSEPEPSTTANGWEPSNMSQNEGGSQVQANDYEQKEEDDAES